MLFIVSLWVTPNPSMLARSSSQPPRILSYGTIDYLKRSVTYHTKYGLYRTSDEVLRRDFSRFKNDGIEIVNLSVQWYRLEGDTRGDYDGPDYGKVVLDGVKRAVKIAVDVGLKPRIECRNQFDIRGGWQTPDYVIDPLTGKNIQMAIVRSEEMREAFLDTYNHTVSYLSDVPIWGWTLLTEPYIWPRTLPPPYEDIDQKENFITLMQELAGMVRLTFGNETNIDINFCNEHVWYADNGTIAVVNLFEKDWEWESRIFQTLNSIRWSFHPFQEVPQPKHLVYNDLINILEYNILESRKRGVKVFVTAGTDGENDSVQTSNWMQLLGDIQTFPLDGIIAFCWNSGNHLGQAMNLCADTEGNPRPAYYEFINF